MTDFENYLQNVSTEELSEVLDCFFINEFNEIDPEFPSHYLMELDRLRSLDSLKTQIDLLRKQKKSLKAEEEYKILIASLDTIEEMYNDWKNSSTPEDREGNFDIDDIYGAFAYAKWDEIKRMFPDIKISVNLIRKMIRTAKARNRTDIETKPNPSKRLAPPEKIEMEFQKNRVAKLSQKSNAELLQILGKDTLDYFAYMANEALETENTMKLKIAITFVIAHFCVSNTKGKENPEKTRHLHPIPEVPICVCWKSIILCFLNKITI